VTGSATVISTMGARERAAKAMNNYLVEKFQSTALLELKMIKLK
jgi:hypothetical protein